MNTNRNIAAEAFDDQVTAAIRDGEPLPDGPLCAAAARTIPDATTSSERFNAAQASLLEHWADKYGVDRPGMKGTE